jgi:Tfp pilus assembly protein PilV
MRAKRPPCRGAGLTLLEVVLALAIVALALLGWTVLQGRAARAERGTRIRRDVASWMRDELRIQRNVRAFDCRSRPTPTGWMCSVERTCLDAATPCETESVRVTIAPPEGPALHGATAVWWPLQRAPVGAPP